VDIEERDDNRPDVLAYGGDLSEDHPGFTDTAYRERRAEIGRIAEEHRRGDPITPVPYSDEEHEVWRLVKPKLDEAHRAHTTMEIVSAGEAFEIAEDHVPQLDEVTKALAPLTGFGFEPVPGLVSPEVFYGSLGDDIFNSTQYIRHPSKPFYTPEPDVIHEVLGHGTMLASPLFADLYRMVGDTAKRLETKEAMQFLSRVFWFTMEFGVVREHGNLRAYGAGLLSSVGELEAFRDAEIREFDLVEMGTRAYDITRYQDVLFAPDSPSELVDTLRTFLSDFDDEHHRRLLHDRRN
jgi:phenylalanine-4-hydroxylase